MKTRTMLKAINKKKTYREMEKLLKMPISSISDVITGKQKDVMHATHRKIERLYVKVVKDGKQ